ncbi:MAG: transglutaminaseTgpA domain-containing protein [Parvibaculales bacterium]
MSLPVAESISKSEMQTSIGLLFLAFLPIALAFALQTHGLVFVNWLAMWALVALPKNKWRLLALIVSIPATLLFMQFYLTIPSDIFFMSLVLVFSVPEQLNKAGLPNPFNLLGVIFSALCVMVLSVNLLVFVLMLVSCAFYIGVFVLRHNRMPLSGLRIRLLPVIATLGGAFLVTVILFLLLPRLDLQEIPSFQFDQASSGVTDKLNMGRFSSVITREEIAFRAFMPRPPENEPLYWRVYLLTENYQGEWVRGIADAQTKQPVTFQAGSRKYQIRHASPSVNWLPVLGMPSAEVLSPQIRQTRGGELVSQNNQALAAKAWQVSSLTSYDDLDLPEITQFEGNPKLRAWAQTNRARFQRDIDFINFVLAYFSREGFYYNLQAPRLSGDKVDAFFFDTRIGYCSHYAIAFTSILRAVNIPANIVVGYSGGSWNEFGDYMVVRQSDAHAWVEAKPDNMGWQRFDPTLFVPFQDQTTRNLLADTPNPLLNTREPTNALSARFAMWLRWADSFLVQLNNDIVLYNEQSRSDLFKSLNLEKLINFILFWLVVSLALVSPFALLRWYLLRDSLVSLDKKFLKITARQGVSRQLNEGRLDFARRYISHLSQSQNMNKQLEETIMRYMHFWCRCYFSSHKTQKADIKYMYEILRQIEIAASR